MELFLLLLRFVYLPKHEFDDDISSALGVITTSRCVMLAVIVCFGSHGRRTKVAVKNQMAGSNLSISSSTIDRA